MTEDHCKIEKGCQSGCVDAALSVVEETSSTVQGAQTSPVAAESETTPSPANEGNEPVLGIPSSIIDNAPSTETEVVTLDGTCGAENENIVCGDWWLGGCCSLYGYCGNT